MKNEIKEGIKESFCQIRWYIKEKMKRNAIKELHEVQKQINTKFCRGLTFVDCAGLQKTHDGLMARTEKLKDEVEAVR